MWRRAERSRVAAELTRLGAMAATHPASCAFLSWRYGEATWQQPAICAAWDKLLALAEAGPGRECRAARNVADVKGACAVATKAAAE